MADEIKLGADFSKVVDEAKKVDKALDGVGQSATHSKDAIEDAYEVLAGSGSNFAQLQQAQKSSDAYVAKLIEQARAQRVLAQEVADSAPPLVRYRSEATKAAEAAEDAGKKTKGYGNAIQTTAFAVQDFTSVLGTQGLGRAIGSVQNNIPSLITQLGGAAGLAGAISIVSIGAGLLYDNWDKLTGKLGEGLPKVPEIAADLGNLQKVLKSVSDEIAGLEEKSLTDALSHPELKRLEALKSTQSQAAEAAADNGLVEGIKSSTGDKYKALTDQVKKAVAAAGGGEAVAGDIATTIGAPYKEGVAKLADVLRGATNLDVENLRRDSPIFKKAFDQIEEDLDREAEEFMKRQANANEARLQEYMKGVKEAFDKEVDGMAKTLAEGYHAISESVRKQIEDDQLAAEKDARDHPGQDIIRDVEVQDFQRTSVDKYGREKTVAGLGLSRDQVRAAADASREFQQTMGFDDRTAAQYAIQEQIVKNQQGMADRFGRADARLTTLLQQAGTVPSICEFGY
ncbi:hypothetical protein [Paludisphaera rhizosphaerae]|uniref:hypothetical protein n=1 Tax=Paludisphaera rhizosphaerae TaxID=2711216 RepID=UPI0013EB06CE|nr:hypothetical protein [Paludisphaera rhizosphaerae]